MISAAGSPNASGVVLHPPVPNPFNPATTLAFELPGQENVDLRVFDLSGRLVRVLIDGHLMQAGHREVVWDGRDDTGRQVASGVYFYRLTAGDFSDSRKMVILK